MKFLHLLIANLFRRKIRTLLTIASFVVALFLFGLLATMQSVMNQGTMAAGVDRLAVINKTSLIMPLPYAYRDQLLQIPGVSAVSFASWFGGVYQNESNFFAQFAVDHETYFPIFPELVIPPDQMQEFLRDKEACIAGRSLVKRFGWKLGDRIPLVGTIWPGTWEFNLRAIYDGKRPEDDTTGFLFRYDYLDQRRQFGQGTVGWYIVRVSNPDNAVQIAKAINDRFANSPYETLAQTEKAFAASFVKQIGNVQLIIMSIGLVVFFTLLLVTGNTMAISVRERTNELAVLKAVGFSNGLILILVIVESVILALIGGGLGIVLAKLFTLNGDPTGGMLGTFYMPIMDVIWGFGLSVLIGLASGVFPAVAAMRLRVVDALRRV